VFGPEKVLEATSAFAGQLLPDGVVRLIVGYAVRKGAELGVPVATLGTCYRLLAGIDRAHR
jgi:hypothetical protein